jgi:hypothetical protein
MKRSLGGCTVRAAAIAGGLFLGVSLGAVTAHADGLKAGLWRVTNTPQLNGVTTPPRQNMRCLTEADVSDLDKTFSPVSRTTNSTCERIEHESTPQRLKWHLKCTGQIDMDVAGEFLFDTPEHYTATVDSQASMLGRVMQSSHVKIDAQRVGECQ